MDAMLKGLSAIKFATDKKKRGTDGAPLYR